MSDREESGRTIGQTRAVRRELRAGGGAEGRLAEESAPATTGPRASGTRPIETSNPQSKVWQGEAGRASSLANLPGVKACWVGDLDGLALDEGAESDQRGVLSAAVALARHLGVIGAQLGLGFPRVALSKSAQRTLATAFPGDAVVALDVEPSRASQSIEAALLGMDWQNASDWVLSSRDIEYLPEETSARAPQPSASVEQLVQPVAPGAAGSACAPAGSVASECARLRRALAKGQLLAAAQAATRLRDMPSPAHHPFGERDAALVFRPLLSAIADIISGDVSVGLHNLQLVRTAPLGPSLEWAAQLWSARAHMRADDGLRAAKFHAEAALRSAAGLDVEARAASSLLLAELENQDGDWPRALEHIESARAAFGTLGQEHELAACWLLEAQVWASLQRNEDSLEAAERARSCHPSWPAPVTFIVKQALGAGRPEAAERAVEGLLAAQPAPPEAERDRRLLEHVRAGDVGADTAREYLELLETPLDARRLRRLQEIAVGSPRVPQFRETLGWKLLEAGEVEAAYKVFKRLSARDDLAADLRASVLLGLGCVATAEAGTAPPSIKLRAVVSAAPDPFGAAQAAATASVPSVKQRKTDPLDLRVRENNLTPTPGNPRLDKKAPRTARSGPSFTGSLQLSALPELLEVLRTGKKTGTLVCSSAAGIGAVYLRSGKIIGVAAPGSAGLSEHLLAHHAITEDQLRAVQQIAKGTEPSPPLELALLEQGVITTEQLQRASKRQALEAFAELLEWHQGQFAFERELVAPPIFSAAEIELEPHDLLHELRSQQRHAAGRPSR